MQGEPQSDTATPVNVAIIGAGIGSAHLDAYIANAERYCVKVICDLDAARARLLTDRCGADYCPSLSETLARDDLELIDVCLPPKLHKDAILDALAARKHVICEKPLVSSLAEVDHIEQAARKAQRHVIPVYQYRFGHGFEQLSHLVDTGLAGKPFVATLETHWDRDAAYYAVPWRGKWATELGGAVVGHAIHCHDLVVQVLGPIASVQARLATRVNAIEVEDCAAIIFEMASGALVTSSITLGGADNRSRLRFCFENLSAESGLTPYSPASSPWTFTARPPMAQPTIDDAVSHIAPQLEGFARQFELAHATLRESTPPPVTLSDARASLELITAIYAADAQACSIALPLGMDAPGYMDWSQRD